MAQSSAITSATTKLYFSPTLPATFDSAGYTAVTGWVLVSEVSNIGQFGGKTSVQKHIPVDTATVVKRAGSVDYGTMSLTLARHKGADFTGLVSAFNSRASISFKVVYPTALGDVEYFTGIVTGVPTNIGNADAILQSNVDVELDSPVITVTGS
jgi:hypothetical protein